LNERRTLWRPDLRVTGIPLLFPNSTLEAGLSLYIDSSNGDASPATNSSRQSVSPWFTVQWALSNFLGGFNKLAYQWAQGSASSMSGGPVVDADSGSKQWRVVEHMVYQPTDSISGALVFVYQDKTNVGGTSNKSWGAGIRPAIQLNDYFKIEADLGYNSVTPKTGANQDSRGLFKFTLAPTITAMPGPGGTYFTRPVLRAFLTYATWNDAAKAAGIAGQPTTGVCTTGTGGTSASAFGCDTNGLTFGAQVEAWY
jgi:maltoporin